MVSDFPSDKVISCIDTIEKYSKFYTISEIKDQLLISGWPKQLVEKVIAVKV